MPKTFTVTRRFTFEAAHRLMNHAGRCKHIHGHSYKAFVTVESRADRHPGAGGMLVDFADLRPIKEWIDANWDHNLIVEKIDPVYRAYLDPTGGVMFAGKQPYFMDRPPTAENLARHLARKANEILAGLAAGDLRVTQVVVEETENCSAAYSPEYPPA